MSASNVDLLAWNLSDESGLSTGMQRFSFKVPTLLMRKQKLIDQKIKEKVTKFFRCAKTLSLNHEIKLFIVKLG